MNKFGNILNEKCKKFGVILTEEDMASPTPDPASEVSQAQPADAAPMPEQGAGVEKPSYDKPYQDLAKILYKALRQDFDDLQPTLQRKVLALHPDDIKNDQQAVLLFKEVESVLDEVAVEHSSGRSFGPGAMS